MATAPFIRRIYHVTRGFIAYPWNYFGLGWPDQIGCPEAETFHYGESLRPATPLPSTPWTSETQEMLDSLLWLAENNPGAGVVIVIASNEYLPPPAGFQFVENAQIEWDTEVSWVEPYELVLSNGPLPYGRWGYALAGNFQRIGNCEVYAVPSEETKTAIPALAALSVLALLACCGSSGSNVAPGRRRRSP